MGLDFHFISINGVLLKGAGSEFCQDYSHLGGQENQHNTQTVHPFSVKVNLGCSFGIKECRVAELQRCCKQNRYLDLR